jgi:hypothetical protein
VSRVIVTHAVPSHSKETFQSIAIPIIERAKQFPKACFLGNCIQFNGLVLQIGQFHISANLVLMSYYKFQPITQCCPYIGVKVYFSSPFLGLYFLSAPHHIVFAFRRYTELFVFTSNTSMYTSFLQFQLCHRFYVHYVVSFSFYFFLWHVL